MLIAYCKRGMKARSCRRRLRPWARVNFNIFGGRTVLSWPACCILFPCNQGDRSTLTQSALAGREGRGMRLQHTDGLLRNSTPSRGLRPLCCNIRRRSACKERLFTSGCRTLHQHMARSFGKIPVPVYLCTQPYSQTWHPSSNPRTQQCVSASVLCSEPIKTTELSKSTWDQKSSDTRESDCTSSATLQGIGGSSQMA